LIQGELTVSQTGEGQFRSLTDALQRAGPGARIRVLDAADYRGPLVIDRGEQWSGISLEAQQGARLVAPDRQTILRILDTPQVKIKGFRFRAQQEQHAVEIAGNCEGCELTDLDMVQPPQAPRAMITLNDGASGSEQAPIVLRRLKISCGQIGVGLMGMGGEPIRHVRVEENTFAVDQESPEAGVFVILNRPIHQVLVRRNVFQQGRVGVSLLAPVPHQLQNVTVGYNTFADMRSWLNLNGSSLEQDGLSIHGNLILDSSALIWQSPLTEAAVATVAPRWFNDNWWQERPEGNDALWQTIAPFSGDPGIHREPGRPRHLHPKPDSPLLISAAQTGDRKIIGALDPAEPGDGSPVNP
jgi:hypothetical protein